MLSFTWQKMGRHDALGMRIKVASIGLLNLYPQVCRMYVDHCFCIPRCVDHFTGCFYTLLQQLLLLAYQLHQPRYLAAKQLPININQERGDLHYAKQQPALNENN